MKTLLTTLALILLSVGCKTTSDGESASTAKDFGDGPVSGPQKISYVVPTGLSTSGIFTLQAPIDGNALSFHTNCDLQLVSVYAYSEIGWGYMKEGDDNGTWITPSGNSRTFTALQIQTNNYGAPALCTYSVE